METLGGSKSAHRPIHLPEDLRFSVPWNGDQSLLDLLEERVGRFERLYAALPPWIAATGRPWTGGATRQTYRQEMTRLCTRLGRWNVGLTLLANAPVMPIDADALVAEANWAAERVPDVRVVFADLAVAERLAHRLEGVEIGVSCAADVKTPMQATLWKQAANASIITVARSINRDLGRLRAIRNVGVDISVVLMDVCLPDCPWHSSHLVANASGPNLDRCLLGIRHECHPSAVRVRNESPHLLAVKEPLPGHLRFYAGLGVEMKLPGRSIPSDQILQALDFYWEAESLDHPVLGYSEPAEAWDKIATCSRDCAECGYCKTALVRWDGGGDRGDSQGSQAAENSCELEWHFSRSDGASVTIRLVESGKNSAHRTVGHMNVEYEDRDGRAGAEAVFLLESVAELLNSLGLDSIKARPDQALPRGLCLRGFERSS